MKKKYSKNSKHYEITRYHTSPKQDVYDMFKYEKRDATIYNEDGTTETIKNIIAPENWSELAVNIVVDKYFKRKVPSLQKGAETSVKELIYRVCNTIRKKGEECGYFKSKAEADSFEQELTFLCLDQRASFNSPVWFNVGLYHVYGMERKGDTFYYDPKTKEIKKSELAYEHPQASACFINSIEDSLIGIDHLRQIHTRIFEFGSGTGTNFSTLRSKGEPLSEGGKTSGAVSFLRTYDANAGAIKSGGKTRRAAMMNILNIWHPDVVDFINMKVISNEVGKILKAVGWTDQQIYDFLPGENGNNSVRVNDEFMNAVEKDAEFSTIGVKDKNKTKKFKARDLMDMIANAAWDCGDPGLQFDDIINKYNTCKNSGRINASNPCSEFMFLDNSACNLASLNLMKYLNKDNSFDIEGFKHAIKVMITAQDIIVELSSYPREEIAENSYKFRPLGLGYSNLGAVLMIMSLAYDSEKARQFAGSITSLMTATAYVRSAEMAADKKIGPFSEFEKNKEPMLEVINMHKESSEKFRVDEEFTYLIKEATSQWNKAFEMGNIYGFRNAQTTVLAPTGTISFMMDCATTGIEPELALVKYKRLATGQKIKLVNKEVPESLKRLGYKEEQIKEIVDYIMEHNSVVGAPHLQEKHYPIYDCAVTNSPDNRYITPEGHILMMAACQPFISGSISKTVNLPHQTTPDQIKDLYIKAWKLGLKSLAIYRDNCRWMQVLTVDEKKKEEKEIPKKFKRGEREELPYLREGITEKFTINGVGFIFRTGEYQDGRLGEIFIDAFNYGESSSGMLDGFARSLSKFSLQRGVMLEDIVEDLRGSRFEPHGLVNHPYIKSATSPYNFIGNLIGFHYLLDMSAVAVIPEDPMSIRLFAQAKRKIDSEIFSLIEQNKLYEAKKKIKQWQSILESYKYIKDKPEKIKNALFEILRHKEEETESHKKSNVAKTSGKACPKCGALMTILGSCWQCPSCANSEGGCGG